jgi:hypothetical protein
MKISYRKLEDQTYEASNGLFTITVQYGWLRVGGSQWIISNVGKHQWITGTSRKAACEKAFAILQRS